MLVLGVSVAALRLTTPTRPALHPALALAPHLLLALSVISSIAWIAWVHVRAARRRDAAHATVSNGTAGSLAERQPLLNGEDDSVRSGVKLGGEDSEGPTGWELLLGIAKVLVAVALVGVTVGKLLGVEDGSKTRWTRVFEGGMIAVPVGALPRRPYSQKRLMLNVSAGLRRRDERRDHRRQSTHATCSHPAGCSEQRTRAVLGSRLRSSPVSTQA